MILHAKLMNILKIFHLYQNNMYQITMQIEIKTLIKVFSHTTNCTCPEWK